MQFMSCSEADQMLQDIGTPIDQTMQYVQTSRRTQQPIEQPTVDAFHREQEEYYQRWLAAERAAGRNPGPHDRPPPMGVYPGVTGASNSQRGTSAYDQASAQMLLNHLTGESNIAPRNRECTPLFKPMPSTRYVHGAPCVTETAYDFVQPSQRHNDGVGFVPRMIVGTQASAHSIAEAQREFTANDLRPATRPMPTSHNMSGFKSTPVAHVFVGPDSTTGGQVEMHGPNTVWVRGPEMMPAPSAPVKIMSPEEQRVQLPPRAPVVAQGLPAPTASNIAHPADRPAAFYKTIRHMGPAMQLSQAPSRQFATDGRALDPMRTNDCPVDAAARPVHPLDAVAHHSVGATFNRVLESLAAPITGIMKDTFHGNTHDALNFVQYRNLPAQAGAMDRYSRETKNQVANLQTASLITPPVFVGDRVHDVGAYASDQLDTMRLNERARTTDAIPNMMAAGFGPAPAHPGAPANLDAYYDRRPSSVVAVAPYTPHGAMGVFTPNYYNQALKPMDPSADRTDATRQLIEAQRAAQGARTPHDVIHAAAAAPRELGMSTRTEVSSRHQRDTERRKLSSDMLLAYCHNPYVQTGFPTL